MYVRCNQLDFISFFIQINRKQTQIQKKQTKRKEKKIPNRNTLKWHVCWHEMHKLHASIIIKINKCFLEMLLLLFFFVYVSVYFLCKLVWIWMWLIFLLLLLLRQFLFYLYIYISLLNVHVVFRAILDDGPKRRQQNHKLIYIYIYIFLLQFAMICFFFVFKWETNYSS